MVYLKTRMQKREGTGEEHPISWWWMLFRHPVSCSGGQWFLGISKASLCFYRTRASTMQTCGFQVSPHPPCRVNRQKLHFHGLFMPIWVFISARKGLLWTTPLPCVMVNKWNSDEQTATRIVTDICNPCVLFAINPEVEYSVSFFKPLRHPVSSQRLIWNKQHRIPIL